MLSDRIKKFGLQSNTEPGSDPKTEQPDGSFILRPYAEQLSPDRAPEGSDIHAVFNGYVSIGKVKSMVL